MSANDNQWYRIRNTEQLDSPALVIYAERVKANIQLLKGMTGDLQMLRPHVKTHKSPDVTRLLMQAGIHKFKCATIAEAEMLAIMGAEDVLLAYQPVGPKIDRLISLLKKFPATVFSCLIDHPDAAMQVSARATFLQQKLNVFIDLNVGMDRTGIPPGREAAALYAYCSGLEGIHIKGLHVYDGHIHDADLAIRTSKCNEAFAAVENLREDLLREEFDDPVIVAGGSPTFPIHAKRKNVECSPGTFIYWDASYMQTLTEQPFLPAALVLTRVVSMPAAGALCTDLGHKSIASENPLSSRVKLLNGLMLEPVAHSEEHLTLKSDATHLFKIGDLLYGMPYHICPTIALYERAYIVEDGFVCAQWRIMARDRTLSI